jgi:hypothetical protein
MDQFQIQSGTVGRGKSEWRPIAPRPINLKILLLSPFLLKSGPQCGLFARYLMNAIFAQFRKEVSFMQANQLTLVNRNNIEQTRESLFAGRVSGWLGRMFGCWHKEMSRPFSRDGQTYRACVTCGARRTFNVSRWEMRGGFYYSLPTGKHFRALNGLTPRTPKAGNDLRGMTSTEQYA